MTGESHTPKPKTLFRRCERFAVGAVMTVMAFVLERLVMRSIRKGGGDTPEAPTTALRTKGAEVDLDQ
jgi:hypothetical protein